MRICNEVYICLYVYSCIIVMLLRAHKYFTRLLEAQQQSSLHSKIFLIDTRDHNEPPLRITAPELPPVPILLLPPPRSHLHGRNRHKNRSAPTPIRHPHSNPCHNLEKVIRARHRNNAEYASCWNPPLGATRRPQIHERDMRAQIPQLANHKQQDRNGIPPSIRRDMCRRTVEAGRVRAQRDVKTAEDPVVSGILEDVEEGHGCIGEAVDEEGFEFALGEV